MKKLIKRTYSNSLTALHDFIYNCQCKCMNWDTDRYCDYAYNYNQHNDPPLPYE